MIANAGTERWAQERLYRDYVQLVGHIARTAAAHQGDLEDIVHETFLTAFVSISQLQSPSAVRGWLAKLTIRQVARVRRWRPWLTLFASRDEETRAWETMLDASATGEMRAEVQRVSAVLKQQRSDAQLIWVLHRWSGLSLDETATACECSTATVKRRLAAVDEALLKWQENAR